MGRDIDRRTIGSMRLILLGRRGRKIILMAEEYVRKVEGWVQKQNLGEQKEAKRKQKKSWQFWK